MALIGYARCSTADQRLDLQVDVLTAAGTEKIFTDQASGSLRDRPALAEVLAYLRQGDVLVVWRLDRLGRSLRHPLDLVADLAERGIGFRSLTEAIDTDSASGRMLLAIIGDVAEMERELVRERTCAGLAAARQRGAVFGRPSARTDAKVARARELLASGMTAGEVAGALGTSRGSLYGWLALDAA